MTSVERPEEADPVSCMHACARRAKVGTRGSVDLRNMVMDGMR